MNLLIAKAYRTTSSEALCILAGTTPIIIKAEEAAKRYDVGKDTERTYRRLTEKLNSTNGCTLLTSLTSMDATTKQFGSTQMVARVNKGWEPGR